LLPFFIKKVLDDVGIRRTWWEENSFSNIAAKVRNITEIRKKMKQKAPRFTTKGFFSVKMYEKFLMRWLIRLWIQQPPSDIDVGCQHLFSLGV
jgi:hypothetical protein